MNDFYTQFNISNSTKEKIWVWCKTKRYLHISWKLLHKLTVRSESIAMNVWISPSVNFDRSARLIYRHWQEQT